METTFEVFISDTVHGTSDLRKYKTRDRAEARYTELKRGHKPNSHSTVVLRLVGPDGNVQIYPEQILGR